MRILTLRTDNLGAKVALIRPLLFSAAPVAEFFRVNQSPRVRSKFSTAWKWEHKVSAMRFLGRPQQVLAGMRQESLLTT